MQNTSFIWVIIVSVLSPQLLIPPHSVQAEASGGTVEHKISMYGPAKPQGLCATLDPIQKQPQDVNRGVHVPVQYTSTCCVKIQSHTVAVEVRDLCNLSLQTDLATSAPLSPAVLHASPLVPLVRHLQAHNTAFLCIQYRHRIQPDHYHFSSLLFLIYQQLGTASQQTALYT